MKGVHPHKNGKWRVSIMIHGERMTKVCPTFKQAVSMAHSIRYHLTLKHFGHTEKGQRLMKLLKDQTTGNFTLEPSRDNSNPNPTAKPLVPQTFTFPATGQGVRIIERGEDGQPWFVARDVADALDYGAESRVSMIFKNVPDCWKGGNRISTLGGIQNVLTLSEQGLYFFLGRSDKPKALPYQMWIAGEVVPSIRRTGGYIIAQPEESPEIIMARALFVAKDSIDRLNHQLAAAQPKVETFDALLNTEGTYTVTETAKHFKMSAQRLNELLVEEKWMFKKSVDKYGKAIPTVHMPRQHVVNQGYAVVKTRKPLKGGAYPQTFITPKGLIAIERLLKRRLE